MLSICKIFKNGEMILYRSSHFLARGDGFSLLWFWFAVSFCFFLSFLFMPECLFLVFLLLSLNPIQIFNFSKIEIIILFSLYIILQSEYEIGKGYYFRIRSKNVGVQNSENQVMWDWLLVK